MIIDYESNKFMVEDIKNVLMNQENKKRSVRILFIYDILLIFEGYV